MSCKQQLDIYVGTLQYNTHTHTHPSLGNNFFNIRKMMKNQFPFPTSSSSSKSKIYFYKYPNFHLMNFSSIECEFFLSVLGSLASNLRRVKSIAHPERNTDTLFMNLLSERSSINCCFEIFYSVLRKKKE